MKYVSGWNKSMFEEVSSKKTSKSSSAIRRKLARIRQKLYAGGRLTAEEKAFLRQYAPSLYEKAMAIERERAAYEERLKKCRTKEEAERIKMEKMIEEAASKEEDMETRMMRMAQTKAAEEDAAPAVNKKPSQVEEDKKRQRAERKRQEDKKVQDRKKMNKERLDRERADKKRWKDRYYESERLQEQQEEQYMEKESEIIYGRPKHAMPGHIRPLPGGIYQQVTLEDGQEVNSADGGESGGTVSQNAADAPGGRAAFARGYAAYQAVLQDNPESEADFEMYGTNE